jgi:hypothetical protein
MLFPLVLETTRPLFSALLFRRGRFVGSKDVVERSENKITMMICGYWQRKHLLSAEGDDERIVDE